MKHWKTCRSRMYARTVVQQASRICGHQNTSAVAAGSHQVTFKAETHGPVGCLVVTVSFWVVLATLLACW